MMDQIITTLISTIIGGLLVIIANYFTQKLIYSGERKRVVREKIEEVYRLKEDWGLELLKKIHLIYQKLGKEEMFTQVYYSGVELSRPDADTEKMFIFIRLYMPNLGYIVDDIDSYVTDFYSLYSDIMSETVKPEKINSLIIKYKLSKEFNKTRDLAILIDRIWSNLDALSTDLGIALAEEIRKQL